MNPLNRRNLMLAAAMLALSLTVNAADRATKDEAKAMAKKAADLFKEKGKDAFAVLNNKQGPFVDRDLYVAVLDASGNVLAHGANEKLVGKSLAQLKDADGKPFVQDIMAHVTANKPGWIEYRWVNPVSKEIEAKSSYVEVQGAYGFMVGAYSK
ncbi:MAG: cache domain-containing protein [Burkholderiales bacterium]|nr:cache domain-containing protein [Burkholderiales bacterium]